jgi:hypothetical protein
MNAPWAVRHAIKELAAEAQELSKELLKKIEANTAAKK